MFLLANEIVDHHMKPTGELSIRLPPALVKGTGFGHSQSLLQRRLVISSDSMADDVTIKVIRKVSELSRDQWDSLANGTTPFAKWDWLDSLEQSGCVSEESG
ncbi:MAG: peptidogalycan biosysnthesis protein, partial [Candidatus Binatia bacterium]